MSERKPANTIEALDVHVSYVQAAIDQISQRMDAMATKSDIEQLRREMQGFAKKSEVDELRTMISRDSLPSRFDRFAKLATQLLQIGALGAGVWLLLTAVVHINDAVQALPGVATKVGKP